MVIQEQEGKKKKKSPIELAQDLTRRCLRHLPEQEGVKEIKGAALSISIFFWLQFDASSMTQSEE